MTQDEIIELAKSINEDWWLDDIDLQAFAKLVAEKEREACAKFVEDFDEYGYKELANQIRAREQA